MKYVFLIPVCALVLAACDQAAKGKNGVVYKSTLQYNDYIIDRQSSLMKDLIDMETVSQTDLDSTGKILDKVVLETDEIITDLKGMPPYKSDSSFRDAAINSFSFYKKIFSNEYKRIIDIRKNEDDKTEEGIAELNDIINNMRREEERIDKVFHNAQQTFAEKNHMGLRENELQKRIKESDK